MEKKLYEGICFGGPMNGEIGISRFAKGFLLVRKETDECWVYDWNDGSSSFTVRDDKPMPISREGRLRAAEGSDYDVLAVGNGN